MAKRFTDTEKWKKDFIKSLPSEYKILWLYILDECNHAGIWEVELEVARLRTGLEFSREMALLQFDGKVVVFDGGKKWFIPDFITFQYGELNPKNNAHSSVISILTKYKLLEKEKNNEPLMSPSQGALDKDKDMDKDKGGVGEKSDPLVIPITQQVFSFDENLPIPVLALEAAEMNQFTHTRNRNTDFVKAQWKVFVKERMLDPPMKRAIRIEDLTSYFLNWIRNHFPKKGRFEESTSPGPGLKKLN